MWHDYLTSQRIKNRVVGVDINPEARMRSDESRSIMVEIGDQTDANFLSDVSSRYGPFDIIIDDGSHICEHQRVSFEILFSQLKPRGIYIVEDVCTSYWGAFNGDGAFSMINYCKELVDDVNFYGLAPDGKVDRDELRLSHYVKTNELNIRSEIRTIQFCNSTILIQKR